MSTVADGCWVSFGGDEKVLEIDGGCITRVVYLMPLSCTL